MKPLLKKISCLILVLALTIVCFANGNGVPAPVAEKGVIDLRNENLFDKSLAVNGQWGFYWDQLLSPDSVPSKGREYVPFPKLWRDIELNGHPLSPQGYATYTLTIYLPKEASAYRHGRSPDVYCA